MKKPILFLYCFCFVFCNEKIEINIFYSNPQDLQCNLFKTQVASIIDNRYLNTQNILFKTTLINKNIPPSITKYNIYGNCDLVISMFQDKKEVAFKTLSLDSIHNDFTFKQHSFIDTKNVISNSLLSGIWNFIFQNTKYFYFLNLFFALWCGITSAFLTHQESESFSPSLSLLVVIASTGIGALLSIDFFYTTNKLEFGQVIPLLFLSFAILFPFPFISPNLCSLDTLKNFIKNIPSLLPPSIFLAIALFSFKINLTIVAIYGLSFFFGLYLFSLSERFLALKPFFYQINFINLFGVIFCPSKYFWMQE